MVENTTRNGVGKRLFGGEMKLWNGVKMGWGRDGKEWGKDGMQRWDGVMIGGNG